MGGEKRVPKPAPAVVVVPVSNTTPVTQPDAGSSAPKVTPIISKPAPVVVDLTNSQSQSHSPLVADAKSERTESISAQNNTRAASSAAAAAASASGSGDQHDSKNHQNHKRKTPTTPTRSAAAGGATPATPSDSQGLGRNDSDGWDDPEDEWGESQPSAGSGGSGSGGGDDNSGSNSSAASAQHAKATAYLGSNAVSAAVKQIVREDVAALNKMDGYRAGCVFDDDRGMVLVHIGVQPRLFGIRREQARAWGIDFDRQICATIEFGREYVNSTVAPKKYPTYQSRDHDLGRLAPMDKVSYGLEGMISLRLQKHMFTGKHWPPKLGKRPEPAKKDDEPKKAAEAAPAAIPAEAAAAAAAPAAAQPKTALTREEEHKLIELLDPFPLLDPAFGVFILRSKKWESSASAAVLTDDKQLNKYKALWAEEQAKLAAAAAAAVAPKKEKEEAVALPLATPPGGADIKVEIVKKPKMSGSGGGGGAAELDRKSSSSNKKSVEPEEKDSLVLSLASMFIHVPHNVIKFALTKSKRDPEKAVSLLSDDKQLDKLFAEFDKNKDMIAFAAEAGMDYHELASASGGGGGGDGYSGSYGGGRRRGAYNLDSLAKTNFLIRVLNFIEHSIVTCGIFCLMCEKGIEFGGFKPTVCDSSLCLYKYQELGMGFDLLQEMRVNAEVVDLLISFASSAVTGNRIEFVFPVHVTGKDPKTGKELSFMSGDTKCSNVVREVIDSLPSIADMIKYNKTSKDLRSHLDNKVHPLAYPFLIWLITSNRAHLRPLKSSERFKDISTDYQYVVCSNAAEREQKWQAMKLAKEQELGYGKGSTYMFHGSPIGNWHSILRTGMMISGQPGLGASGAAIWMANDFSTSVGYCNRGGYRAGWANSMFGPDIMCMAILELVNDKSKSVDNTQPVNVIADVSIISTRYFLVFKGQMPTLAVRAVNLPIRDLNDV